MNRIRTLSVALLALAVACDDSSGTSVAYASRIPYQVGVATSDPELPPEPRLPLESELCATWAASTSRVPRPDGARAPEADPSPAGAQVAADPAVVNPDQARIQAALDACGASVDAEVGAAIAKADTDATNAQMAAAIPNVNVAGASGEELAKTQYRATNVAL